LIKIAAYFPGDNYIVCDKFLFAVCTEIITNFTGMYSTEQIKELQKLTASLVKTDHTDKAFEIVEDLRKALQFHEYRYYVLNDPLISDTEYDQFLNCSKRLSRPTLNLLLPLLLPKGLATA
jgi:hypothetical protein